MVSFRNLEKFLEVLDDDDDEWQFDSEKEECQLL